MLKKMIFYTGVVLVVFLLTGCTIKQNIKPVESFQDKEVCIIENPIVRNGFLPAYRHALEAKQYKVILKPQNESITTCQVTSTYTANWRWDMALYMAYADIRVYKNGILGGEAIYDSLAGGANPGKFINAENKINELVGQLYP
jgi:hypothetical protein